MSEELDKQEENKPERNELGQLLPGHTANPNGRPKGKTMKEFAREFLMNMNDEAKLVFLNSLSKDIVWKMAEGNPHNTEDITSKGEKIVPIYGGNSISRHNSDKENIPTEPENPGSSGGDVS